MEELPVSLTFREKLSQFTRSALDFVFRQVLLVDLIIFVVVLVSFIFLGPLTALALSERIFWAGMIAMLFGAVVTVATLFTGKGLGIPLIIRKPEEARRFLDLSPQLQEEKEKRYNVGARLWLIGLGCVGISALVEHFFA